MLAMGLSGSIPNLCSSLSGFTVPHIYKNYGLAETLGVGAFMCFVSLAFALVFVLIDCKRERHDKQIERNILLIESMASDRGTTNTSLANETEAASLEEDEAEGPFQMVSQ